MADVVLAIDPGRMKCGVAVVKRCSLSMAHQIVCCSVVETAGLAQVLHELAASERPDVIIVGDGTTSSQAVRIAAGLGLCPVEVVDEKFSTLLARRRFFQENPPKGLRRLIPTSLQTPNRPCDDYVAVILAERYLDLHQ